jgi:hypothetical protein
MRSRLVAFCAASAALLTLPLSADAGVSCNLVVDKNKDAYVGHSAAGQNATALDIKSLDVATGKKTLVIVLRMATTNLASDPVATAGMQWDVTFKIAKADHRFTHKVGPNGMVLSDTANADGAAITGVTVKVAGNTVTWTVPRAKLQKLRGKGAVLSGFYAGTSTPWAFDQAPDGGLPSLSRYTDMAKSCVKAA